MELPKTVKVGCYDIAIEPWANDLADDAGHYGMFSSKRQLIRLDDGMSMIKTADTLLHEIMHAVWWAWNLEDKDEEERTVTALATGLTTVWRDNPGLLEWFSAAVKA